MSSTEVKILTRPKCDFCPEPAQYDFKTYSGSWAYGCEADYEVHRYFDTLGVGKGQKLVTP